MIVHRRLGFSGRSRREGDQRDVFGRRRCGLERIRLPRNRRFQFGVAVGTERHGGDAVESVAGLREFVEQPKVAQRERHARLLEDDAKLGRAVERHRGDRNAAGFQHRQPAGNEHRRVRRAQKHAISRTQTVARREGVGDPVHDLEDSRVRPTDAGRHDAAPFAVADFEIAVEQPRRRIDAFGIRHFRKREEQVRHRLARRQAAFGESST